MSKCYKLMRSRAVHTNVAVNLRRCILMCRLQAWFRPHNPGMTAAEALCAPFFTAVINPEPNGDEAV